MIRTHSKNSKGQSMDLIWTEYSYAYTIEELIDDDLLEMIEWLETHIIDDNYCIVESKSIRGCHIEYNEILEEAYHRNLILIIDEDKVDKKKE